MNDTLTGLNSRHQLHIELLARASRATAAQPLALLLLSLRDFPLWQRQLTPLAADRLLRVAGQVVQAAAPETAFAARWDHHSFALLLPDHPLWLADELGEDIRQLAQQHLLPPLLAYQGLALDFHYGAATLPPHDANRLPEAAEQQLQQAQGGAFAALLRDDLGVGTAPGAAEAYIRLAEGFLIHNDPYLRRHGQMTSGYALEVGRRLGLQPTALQELAIAAACADLAMAEAAGSALHKPGCLTLGEYRRMCRHPALAAQLCRSLGLPPGVVETVLCHHEHSDGSGYPEGRKAADIPLSAAILGASGAMAAMLLPRPYRPARKLYAAKAELAAGAEAFWPSQVVRELLTL